MTVKGTVAEDNKVALETESYGELLNGRVYNQSYHLLWNFRTERSVRFVNIWTHTTFILFGF